MKIKDMLKAFAMGFNYEKYFSRREKIFDKETPKFVKNYYKFYLRRVDAKNGADINFCSEGEDCFDGRPTLGHGIKGIVIAGGDKNRTELLYLASGHNRKKQKSSPSHWGQCLYWTWS